MGKDLINQLENQLSASFLLYETYSWLLDCYVLDFFTDEHWRKLPTNWQKNLKRLSPDDIANLLNYEEELKDKVWPLSLIALKSVLTSVSLSRKKLQLKIESPLFIDDEKVLKLFWKNVKEKKRHEISIMSKICLESALKTDCFYIVDIGSGLGHLSRMLNYGYGFNVCTIEAQSSFCKQAKNLDQEFEILLRRQLGRYSNCNRCVHINKKLESDISATDFLSIVKEAFFINSNGFKFGIVGLHPCGDLGATLLKLFNNCDQIKFINMVGCCYMKLTTSPQASYGFPLSDFCERNYFTLSYHSREIACHAIENYIEKLRKNQCWRLKIHTYRALLEKIIVEKCPQYHRCALNNVKYTEDLTFRSYCEKALKKLKINVSELPLNDEDIETSLDQWKEVVVFYSLRLLFAPLIESIILLDRLLYTVETGNKCKVLSVFDSKVSPRTHVFTARKPI